GRLTPVPKLSAWFSGFCWRCPPKKRYTLQIRWESAEEEPQLGWEVEERQNKNQKKGEWMKGSRMPGETASQQHNRNPTVPWFISNHPPHLRPSPPHFSSPNTPRCTKPSSSIALCFLPGTN
ncbi:hypothetical protein GOODEAATRI_017961, partial [Goodea atripinnis]